MNQQPYQTASFDGDEVIPVVEKLQTALEGESRPLAVMALIYAAYVVSFPDIETAHLARGIRETSQHMCFFLDSINNLDGKVKDLKVN